MTIVSSHLYIPAPGQKNADERAAALGMPLGVRSQASAYGSPSLPCAVCDHDGAVVITPEPTTFEEVWAAHDEIFRRPATIVGCPALAPPGFVLEASQVSFSVNEDGSLLTFTVKFADGVTVKSGAVALV